MNVGVAKLFMKRNSPWNRNQKLFYVAHSAILLLFLLTIQKNSEVIEFYSTINFKSVKVLDRGKIFPASGKKMHRNDVSRLKNVKTSCCRIAITPAAILEMHNMRPPSLSLAPSSEALEDYKTKQNNYALF